MEEKEPIINPEEEPISIEREKSSENRDKILQDQVERPEVKRTVKPEEDTEKLLQEKKEKENAYKEEIDQLVDVFEEKGLDAALGEIKKISKETKSPIVVDILRDLLAKKLLEKENND